MTDQRDHLEAFDDEEHGDTDFASEHSDTAVDPHVITAEGDGAGEEESPRGWDGMDRGGPP